MRESIIVTQDLRASFGANPVLDGIDLTVREGAIHALLGPNGAGKTTLVRILTTLLKLDSGSATVAGHDVVRERHQVREAISLTGQYAALDEALTGQENLQLMARLWRLDRREAQRRAVELLTMLELVPFASNLVRTYSGGMRRKLDLAMSLMGRPRVLFLDEPTTGLDPRSRNALWDIVRDLAGDGTTILLTTQYLEEADRLADRISVIDHGCIVAEGTPRELKSRLAGEFLTLGFPNESSAMAAMAILKGERVQSGDGPATLTVATDGTPGHVYAVLERLQRAGATADRLTITAPSLDEVFLSLTQGTENTRTEKVA